MHNLHNPAISIVLLSVLTGFSGCSNGPSDETIAKDIQGKVAADPETKDSQVNVVAKNGHVTLTGRATSPAVQQRLKQIARDEPGAADVDDQTTIQPEVQAAQASPAEEAKPKPIVVPAGTVLTVITGQPLSSKTSTAGQAFPATLAQPVTVGERLALPKGVTVYGSVVTAKAKGKIKGEGQLDLALISVSVQGRTYPIKTNLLSSTVKGKGKRTAATTGGGAAGGALIGGLAGGGKGAGIGALVGGAAGLIGGAATGNKQIELPAESALGFTLSAPLTLPPSSQ